MTPFDALWLLPSRGDVGALVADGIRSVSPVFAPPQGVDQRLVVRTRLGPVLHENTQPYCVDFFFSKI